MKTKRIYSLLVAMAVIGAGQALGAPHFTEYPIPTAGSGPKGITRGSDNHLWFCEALG